MKTTIEMPDHLFQKAKVVAALNGSTLKRFLSDAVKEKLAGSAQIRSEGWRSLFGDLPPRAAREISDIVTAPDFRLPM
jgi:hypothetical protein